jgi:hypothetical protein
MTLICPALCCDYKLYLYHVPTRKQAWIQWGTPTRASSYQSLPLCYKSIHKITFKVILTGKINQNEGKQRHPVQKINNTWDYALNDFPTGYAAYYDDAMRSLSVMKLF